MKVLLINISLRFDSPTLLPPVGIAYIATAIHKAGYTLEILDIDANRYTDDKVAELLEIKEYDIAALGCIVTGYKHIKKFCDMIKKIKDVPIIVGNSVGDSVPEILLKNTAADIVVVGEGDITIIEVLKALEGKHDLESVEGIVFKKNEDLIFTSKRKAIECLDKLPFIEWKLFNVEEYIRKSKAYINEPYPIDYDSVRSLPINTARGCAFNCTFCYHVFKQDKYRKRSAKSVVEEMIMLKERYDINYINFFDELTFYSIKQCEEFANTILENNVNVYWKAACRGNLFKEKDLKLAKKLKKAGCMGLGYSLESANDEILKAMNKKLKVEEFIEQTKVLQKAGLAVWTSLVFGYPQESEESIQQTFDCCYEANIYPSVGYLVPLPGTPIYEYTVNAGLIKNEEQYLLDSGDRQDFRINLTSMDRGKVEGLIKFNLQRISDKLNLNLDEAKLIKTGHYKHKNLELKGDLIDE